MHYGFGLTGRCLRSVVCGACNCTSIHGAADVFEVIRSFNRRDDSVNDRMGHIRNESDGEMFIEQGGDDDYDDDDDDEINNDDDSMIAQHLRTSTKRQDKDIECKDVEH